MKIENLIYNIGYHQEDNAYYVVLGPIYGYINNSYNTKNTYIFVKLEEDKISEIDSFVASIYRNSDTKSKLVEIILDNSSHLSLVYGENIFISQALYDLLATDEMDPYIKNLEDLESIYNKSLLNHYTKVLSLEYTEDDLYNLYATFCRVILDQSEDIDLLKVNNTIYKKVLEFFSNYKTDETLSSIGLILGSTINYTSQTNYESCGCSNSQKTNSTGDTSCYNLYSQSMILYLKQMLGDIDFYNDWFFFEDIDQIVKVNTTLIDNLILLLEDFMKLELSYPNGQSKHNCDGSISTSLTYFDTIRNYIKVLNWIKNCQIDANTNKIKLYGSNFGELLPNLQF